MNKHSKAIASAACGVYGAALFGGSLAAYAVAGVPIQWIALVTFAVAAIFLLLALGIPSTTGTSDLIALTLYALIVNVAVILTGKQDTQMPALATTSYFTFVSLRYINILCVYLTILYLRTMLEMGKGRSIINITVAIGAVVSLFALYVYIAQTKGLPEPSRSRIGTSGGEQSVLFTYAFHRALGSFREPAHLAEWLIVPLFLSMMIKSRLKLVVTCLIASAILLTGSLTGMVSVALGWVASLIIRSSIKYSVKQVLGLAAPVLGFALLIFTALVASNSIANVDLGGVVWERLQPIVETRSMEGTNRNYTWDYVFDSPPSLLGVGLGNSGLRFGQYLQIPLVPSFLSLYFNIAYSAGFIGIIFLVRFLFRPVVGFIKRSTLHPPELVAAYIAYLIVFAIHSEELSFQFAILWALATWTGKVRNYSLPTQTGQMGETVTVSSADVDRMTRV